MEMYLNIFLTYNVERQNILKNKGVINMTELTTGKVKFTDLAEWFGIKPNSFLSAKKKKLEELKEFADYELVSKQQILITKVKYPFYVKKNSKNYEIIKKQITKTWNPDGIDTCKRVSHQIYTDKSNELTLSQSTTYVSQELSKFRPHQSFPDICYLVAPNPLVNNLQLLFHQL